MKKFSVAIIGLGQIGQGYDYDKSSIDLILTHASAYCYHDKFELVAAVDPDPIQRGRFISKFKLPVYEDVASLVAKHRPDIFSICTPSSQHFRVFQQIIPHRPAAILCEKPIALELSEAKEMVNIAESQHCALLVNYMRRFEPGVKALKETLRRRDVGQIEKGVCWYSKGILNNGSHYIDLLRFLLEDVTDMCVIKKGRKTMGDDPEPDVFFRFGQVPVFFLALREEFFSVGRLELMGTGGHILYDDFGDTIRIRNAEADVLLKGYRVLSRKSEDIPTDLGRCQWHVVDHLYQHLITGKPLLADGRSAVENLAVIDKIKQSCMEANK
ncbi:MAG: Gfo/Idh/MocA family oxidoreductase [Syntrophales bacterium]